MALSFKYFPERPNVSSDLAAKKVNIFKGIINNARTQFFYTFNRTELETTSREVYKKFSDRKVFVHIGIGGSSLGPEMMVNALQKNNTRFVFINNIDPEEIYSQLQSLANVPD